MRLSSIYSNHPSVFPRIDFRPGLNVILGEIRHPENRKKDTHNLGKTTLGLLLDYCLLRDRDRSDLFMHQHEDLFIDFDFFLEIELHDRGFITLRRSVRAPTKINLVRHAVRHSDFSTLADEGWDHAKVPLKTAKQLILDVLAFSPRMEVREALTYSLRLQGDYADVFRPLKWTRSKDRDYKPVVMQFLGLDGTKTEEIYNRAEEVESLRSASKHLATAKGGEKKRKKDDLDHLRGVLRERLREQEAAERELELLQFAPHDARVSEELTEEIERRIADLNQRRYSLQMAARRIKVSLADEIAFDVTKLRALYEDAKVYLGDQVIRDFEQLVRFNHELTEERNELLRQEAATIDAEIADIGTELATLDAHRAEKLRELRTEESIERFRALRNEITRRQAELVELERRIAQHQQADEAERKAREAQELLERVTEGLRREIHQPPMIYQQIQTLFSDFVRDVTGKGAVLSTQLNERGSPMFRAEILDLTGEITSEADGNTYRRLLCIAFDVAVLKARLDERFVHWTFHDGALETLDDRKKHLLVAAFRTSGLQHIVTAIDSDLPTTGLLAHEEIVRVLHDDGEDGRLFRMPPW